MLESEFMRLAFGAGAVVGVLAPAVGFFLVQRRQSLIGDGIGHVAFAGVAFGYLVGIDPVATALVASVAGAIAIEWLRAEPSARAVGVEADRERAERIAANALALGVPQLEVRHGRAPAALERLDPPDAIFLGGGLAEPGLLDRCWAALRPGGRLVAHAVTLEGEQALHAARAAHGGRLLRIELSHAEPLGAFTGWQPQRPVVQWLAYQKEA
jgi:precorrin-6B methylase 2